MQLFFTRPLPVRGSYCRSRTSCSNVVPVESNGMCSAVVREIDLPFFIFISMMTNFIWSFLYLFRLCSAEVIFFVRFFAIHQKSGNGSVMQWIN